MWGQFVNLFLNLLLYIYKLVGNFGWAIIIFTVVIKLLTHPLMVSQIKSSAAMSKMQEDPEYLAIQEKYKGNQEKLAEEQMKMYKKMGVNPMASCLPTFIQLPIIFALYQAVIAAIVSTPLGMLDLMKRVMPKVISIPEVFPINPNFLWMNLGLPERLEVPGLSFGIPVLAILVLLTTILQTKLTQPPQQPSENGASTAMMSGMMNIYMPLLMGFMAYQLASGLALYFLISNIFTIVQYAAMGNIHWENLKFWEKKKPAPKPTSRRAQAQLRRVEPAKETAAPSKSDTPAEKAPESNTEPIPQRIDYREFKNKKKPKKNQ